MVEYVGLQRSSRVLENREEYPVKGNLVFDDSFSNCRCCFFFLLILQPAVVVENGDCKEVAEFWKLGRSGLLFFVF